MPIKELVCYLSVDYKLTFINYQFSLTNHIVSSLGKVNVRMLIIDVSSSYSSTE